MKCFINTVMYQLMTCYLMKIKPIDIRDEHASSTFILRKFGSPNYSLPSDN